MNQEEVLRTLEGLQTIETVAAALKVKKQSALNIVSKLKKHGYVTTTGGGKQKRLYKISQKKQSISQPLQKSHINGNIFTMNLDIIIACQI